MGFVSFYNKNASIILNESFSKEKRLLAFSEIVDHISGMRQPSAYLCAIVNSLLDAFDTEPEERIINRYVEELSACLHYSEEVELSIVLSEENTIAASLRRLFSDKIQFIPCWAINDTQLEFYDYFIICGEGYSFEDIEKHINEEDRILNLYRLCLNGFIGYPLAWKVYTDYQKNVLDCDCIITGMSYIRDALESKLINCRACSAANSSQDLYYDFLSFKEALKKNNMISKLIIGLAPYSLRYDLSLTQTPYEKNRLYFYYGRFADSHNNVSLKKELEEYYRLLTQFKDILGDDFEEKMFFDLERFLDNEGMNNKRVFSEDNMIPAEIFQMKGKYNKPYEKTLNENKIVLKDFINYALQNNVKVILFIPPYSRWYKERWDIAYKNELTDYCNLLMRDHDIKLVDLSEYEFSNDYFADYAHLNHLGAIYVTSLINRYL